MRTLREVARILEPSAHPISARQIARDLGIGGRVLLREILEFEFVDPQDLGANIAAATQSFNATFGCHAQCYDGTMNCCDEKNLGMNLHAAEVDSFFTGSPPWTVDCFGAAHVIMARGLIQTLKSGEFDRLGYITGHITPSGFFDGSTMHLEPRPIATIDQMMVGDWAYFQNDTRYLTKHPGEGYQGENVIKVSASTYYGFPAGAKTEAQWKQELINAYNSGLPATEHITDIPGFQGNANETFDARSISLDVWKLRRP